jgi:hypothetical protein
MPGCFQSLRCVLLPAQCAIGSMLMKLAARTWARSAFGWASRELPPTVLGGAKKADDYPQLGGHVDRRAHRHADRRVSPAVNSASRTADKHLTVRFLAPSCTGGRPRCSAACAWPLRSHFSSLRGACMLGPSASPSSSWRRPQRLAPLSHAYQRCNIVRVNFLTHIIPMLHGGRLFATFV